MVVKIGCSWCYHHTEWKKKKKRVILYCKKGKIAILCYSHFMVRSTADDKSMLHRSNDVYKRSNERRQKIRVNYVAIKVPLFPYQLQCCESYTRGNERGKTCWITANYCRTMEKKNYFFSAAIKMERKSKNKKKRVKMFLLT